MVEYRASNPFSSAMLLSHICPIEFPQSRGRWRPKDAKRQPLGNNPSSAKTRNLCVRPAGGQSPFSRNSGCHSRLIRSVIYPLPFPDPETLRRVCHYSLPCCFSLRDMTAFSPFALLTFLFQPSFPAQLRGSLRRGRRHRSTK